MSSFIAFLYLVHGQYVHVESLKVPLKECPGLSDLLTKSQECRTAEAVRDTRLCRVVLCYSLSLTWTV